MMTQMRNRPAASEAFEPRHRSPTGFGFEAIMANPDFGRFRRWYDAMSFLPPGRAAVAGTLSAPEAAAEAELDAAA